MRKFSSKALLLFFLFMLASAAVVACGSKITRANFEKIQTDMPQDEVYRILGKPTESSGVGLGSFSGTSATWKKDDNVISIQFLNGKVVAKQFVKGQSAQRAKER